MPYSGSYNEVVEQGQREVDRGYEPELKPLGVNIADYDVIAVGHAGLGTALSVMGGVLNIVLAFSVVTILFKRILMDLGGSDGVASLTIIWYAQGLFGGLFRGYINGVASVVSYSVYYFLKCRGIVAEAGDSGKLEMGGEHGVSAK